MANGMAQQAQQAPQAGGGEQGGGGFSEMVSQLNEGMSAMGEAAGDAGLAPQLIQALQKVQADFQKIAEAMAQGGGGGAPQAAQAGGMQAPEAGGSGARPAGPQGVV